MAGRKPRNRRHRGEGAIFQRCDAQYGCPATQWRIEARKRRGTRAVAGEPFYRWSDADGLRTESPGRYAALKDLLSRLRPVADPRDGTAAARAELGAIGAELADRADDQFEYRLAKARPPHKCRGMWIGQVDLGWVNSKRHRPAVSARTADQVVEKIKELKKTIAETGGQLPEKGLTVAKWFPHWFDNICKAGPTTRPSYRGILNKWIIPYLGPRPLEGPGRLAPEHLRALYTTMAELGSKGARPQCHAIVRKGLEDAKREGKITRNVAKDMGTPAGGGGKREGMPSELARQILSTNAASGDRLRSRWDALLMSGMRQGECIGMELDRVVLDDPVNGDYFNVSWQLKQLQWEHGCGTQAADKRWPCGKVRGGNCPERWMRIPDAYEHRHLEGSMYLIRPKSEESWRQVPILSYLRPSLEARIEAVKEERERYTASYGLLWCQPGGRPLVAKEDLKAWKALCRLAEVPEVDEHTVRHTVGRLLLEAGVDIKVVEAILGHADAKTSRGYQIADLRLAREALGKAMEPVLPVSGGKAVLGR